MQDENARVGYVYNLTTGISESQSLVISGNLALGATKEDMLGEFDKLVAVTNKLAARHLIAKKKAEIAAGETIASACEEDLRIMQERSPDESLTTAERAAKDNLTSSLRSSRHRLVQMRAELASLEAIE